MNDKNTFDNFSDEFKAKLSACKTEEELKKVLADEDIELDPDALDAVSGGKHCSSYSGTTICRVKQPPSCPIK